jgi:hypothetical protein
MERFLIPKDPPLTTRFLTLRARRAAPRDGGVRYRLFWARNGIFHALKALRVRTGARVLVPAYVCSSAVEPIAAYGAGVDFYAVGRDLRLDLDDLAARVGPDTRAVLAVHYFGFPQRMTELRAFCDARGLFLIEDCAHVLRGEVDGRPMGTIGDASVFSWRKFLPLYDGAELRLNAPGHRPDIPWTRTNALFTLKVVKNVLELASGPLPSLLRVPLSASAWRDRLGGRDRRAGTRDLLAVDNNSATFDDTMVDMPMSGICRWIVDHSDVAAIVVRRRRHYQRLQEGLAGADGVVTPLGDLPAGVCPWIFPVLFPGMEGAHHLLRAGGIPAVTWSGVRPPAVSASAFPDADFLYDRLVFLPVHQGLDVADVDLIVKAVQAVGRGAAPIEAGLRHAAGAV